MPGFPCELVLLRSRFGAGSGVGSGGGCGAGGSINQAAHASPLPVPPAAVRLSNPSSLDMSTSLTAKLSFSPFDHADRAYSCTRVLATVESDSSADMHCTGKKLLGSQTYVLYAPDTIHVSVTKDACACGCPSRAVHAVQAASTWQASLAAQRRRGQRARQRRPIHAESHEEEPRGWHLVRRPNGRRLDIKDIIHR